jgi:hypothetical protein
MIRNNENVRSLEGPAQDSEGLSYVKLSFELGREKMKEVILRT